MIRGIKDVMESVDVMCNTSGSSYRSTRSNKLNAPLEYGGRHFLGNLANDSGVYLSDDLSSFEDDEEVSEDEEHGNSSSSKSSSHRRRQSSSLLSFVSDSIDFIACF